MLLIPIVACIFITRQPERKPSHLDRLSREGGRRSSRKSRSNKNSGESDTEREQPNNWADDQWPVNHVVQAQADTVLPAPTRPPDKSDLEDSHKRSDEDNAVGVDIE